MTLEKSYVRPLKKIKSRYGHFWRSEKSGYDFHQHMHNKLWYIYAKEDDEPITYTKFDYLWEAVSYLERSLNEQRSG